ncbi:MAG: hypothetical protein KBF35_08000 [Saprospiraceae bacterium]|nr:hypothetical protein [Saprospiraceae bacterium]
MNSIKFFAVILISVYLSCDKVDSDQNINSEILQLGLNETPISLVDSVNNFVDLENININLTILPESFSLETYFPKPSLIRHQGNQGSCVGWAASNYISFLENYINGNNSSLKEFSPSFIYNQIVKPNLDCKTAGSLIYDACNFLKNNGCSLNQEFQYTESNCKNLPSQQVKEQARKFQIKDWGYVNANLDQFKAMLSQNKKPIIIGMQIDQAFLQHRGIGVIKTINPNKIVGRHAMVIIGYDDSKQAFRLINSWPSWWGDKGFFWLDYSTLFKNLNLISLGKYDSYAMNGVQSPDILISNKGWVGEIPLANDFDGDGKTDYGLRSNGSKIFYLDYAKNGFGNWDVTYNSYGGSNSVPCPSDFDGDGKTDMAIRENDSKKLYIDYAKNGFGNWDDSYNSYGGSNTIPNPSDFDGDGKSDIAIADHGTKMFNIDYAKNGFGTWDVSLNAYGGSNTLPCSADYDGDGKSDIAIIDNGSKKFHIDYSKNGFSNWDVSLEDFGSTSISYPQPADYDGDGITDIGLYDSKTGIFSIDFSKNGFNYFDKKLTITCRGGIYNIAGKFNNDAKYDLASKCDVGDLKIYYSR